MLGHFDGAVLWGPLGAGDQGDHTPEGSDQTYHFRPDRQPVGNPVRIPPLHHLSPMQTEGMFAPAVI